MLWLRCISFSARDTFGNRKVQNEPYRCADPLQRRQCVACDRICRDLRVVGCDAVDRTRTHRTYGMNCVHLALIRTLTAPSTKG